MTDSPEFRRQQAEMQDLRGFLENTMTEKKQPRAIALANELKIDGAYRPLVRMNAAYLIRRQHALIEEMRDALKNVNQFLSHCWRDVNMNAYSLELLDAQMTSVDAALAKAGAQS